VLPVLLTGRIHYQQIAVIQPHVEGRLVSRPRPEAQVAACTQAD
jgi:hypothetical protein